MTRRCHLARREREQTEWKECVANIDDVVATLCAFANVLQNLGGGYMVCGAAEQKNEHGFRRLPATHLQGCGNLRNVRPSGAPPRQVVGRSRRRAAPALRVQEN